MPVLRMRLWWVLLAAFLSSCRTSADSANSLETTTVNMEEGNLADGTEGKETAANFLEDDYMDYQEEDEMYEHYNLIVNTIFISITLFGTVGNVLITITWSKVKQFNSTTFLLSFLGVCDFVFVFIMIFVQTFILVVDYFRDATAWAFFFFVYVSYTAQYASIFTTVLISITRYTAVKFPFKVQVWFKKSTIKRLCAIIVIMSCLFALPASTIACLFVYVFDAAIRAYEDSRTFGNFSGTAENTSNMFTSATNIPPILSTTTEIKFSSSSITPVAFFDGAYDNLTMADDDNMDTMNTIEVCFFMNQFEKASLMMSVYLINVVPWTVVIPMNLLLINQVRKALKDRTRIMSREEQNNATMDVVVVVLTLQSIIAYPVFYVIELCTNKVEWAYYFGGEPPLAIPKSLSIHVTYLRDCLHVLNSSVNIVAYCACGRRFRKLLLEEVLKCGAKAKDEKIKPASKKEKEEVPSTSSTATNPNVSRSTTADDSIVA